MACKLKQIVCITGPVNDTEDICIKESDGTILEYQLSYSTDCSTWSDWMSCEDIPEYTTVLGSDFFLRALVYGNPCCVTQAGTELEYSVSLAPSFDFSSASSDSSYNPYANLDCAIQLYQQLSENVSNIVGIPCYYFKVSPEPGSKDVTFKEYCHLNVSSVKFIKIVVADGKMPSSKPQFDEYGLNWETDWETEVTKATFATAFGNEAQPMEGDLVYIPLMKRMWQVNSAYEEKNEGFMWNSTTFKVFLRKYEIQEALSPGKFEETINSIVKNTYEDLFGCAVGGTNEETFSAPMAADPKDKLYKVYESDAYRRELSMDTIQFVEDSAYHRGMLLADLWYHGEGRVIYQKRYCGDAGTVSFMIQNLGGSCKLLTIGSIEIVKSEDEISFGDISVKLERGTYLVYFRWSSSMKLVESCAVPLQLPEGIPQAKVRPTSYYLDTGSRLQSRRQYTIEDVVTEPQDIVLETNELDYISAIKVFKSFEEPSQVIQQYPNNVNLMINDTVRKIYDKPGWPVNPSQYVL